MNANQTSKGSMSQDVLVTCLKAAGEPTRLRVLSLLQLGELNVTDLTRILGQSQPRISRHLKLLLDAGLVERFREGTWVYFRQTDEPGRAALVDRIVASLSPEDDWQLRDQGRLAGVRSERAAAAQAYFRTNAAHWDELRSRHVSEARVEATMRELLGPGPFDCLVDLGTGTGRILELYSDRFVRGIGIDASIDMLAVARTNLEQAGITSCQVRSGDIYDVPLATNIADAVVIHQVLHFLSDPAAAIAEAARILRSGGKLLIVDFAPHELEFLRDTQAHQRLGFSDEQMRKWLDGVGLQLVAQRDLDEETGHEGALTVSMWLAQA